MREKFKNERIEYKILTLAIIFVTVWFVYRIIHNVLVGYGYPRELLEPANVYLTNLFVQGKSPYSLSALDWKVPGINYDYPFLTSLVVAAIVKITGCSVLAGHYALSLFCILATAFVGFRMINQYSRTTVAPFLGALLFVFCHWRFGYVSAAPDDFGLLLFLLTLDLSVNPKVKCKPLICAIGVTLSFYIKQYFVFSALGIFVYFFLYSKKEAIKFLIYTLILNIVAGVVITVFWPLYWTYSILFLYAGCFSGVSFGFSYLLNQIKYLLAIFLALFVVLVVGLVMGIRKLRATNTKIRNIQIKENDALTLCIAMIPVMLVPLVFFGRNDGAFVSYFLQLWMPEIVVVTLVLFERIIPEKSENVRIKAFAWLGAYLVIALSTIYFGIGKLPMHEMTTEEKADWDKVYSIVDSAKDKGDVLYSRALAYKALEDGSTDCVCGHDGEVSDDTLQILESSDFVSSIFPYARRIIENSKNYYLSLQMKGVDKKYSLITYETEGYNMVFSEDYVLYFGYKPIEKVQMSVGNMMYEIALYDIEL